VSLYGAMPHPNPAVHTIPSTYDDYYLDTYDKPQYSRVVTWGYDPHSRKTR